MQAFMAVTQFDIQIPSAWLQLLRALAFVGMMKTTTTTITTNANFRAIFMVLLRGPFGPG
jgi:hypothetical protein